MTALEIFIANLKEMVEKGNQRIISIDITTNSAKKVVEAYEKYHKNENEDDKAIMEYLIMGEGKWPTL